MTAYMEEIVRRLTALSNLNPAELRRDEVHVIMNYFRQHLEYKKETKNYPVLMFYCNWNLHTDLHKGIVQDVLEKISEVITNEERGHPADRISEILSIPELKSQISKILKEDGKVESGLFEINDNWKAFTGYLFSFILNKPLIRTKPPKTPFWVETLELYDNEGQVFWRIKTSGDAVFIGPLMRTEPLV